MSPAPVKIGVVDRIDFERPKIDDQEEEDEVPVESKDLAEAKPESKEGVHPPNQAPMMKPLIRLKKTAESGTEMCIGERGGERRG